MEILFNPAGPAHEIVKKRHVAQSIGILAKFYLYGLFCLFLGTKIVNISWYIILTKFLCRDYYNYHHNNSFFLLIIQNLNIKHKKMNNDILISK